MKTKRRKLKRLTHHTNNVDTTGRCYYSCSAADLYHINAFRLPQIMQAGKQASGFSSATPLSQHKAWQNELSLLKQLFRSLPPEAMQWGVCFEYITRGTGKRKHVCDVLIRAEGRCYVLEFKLRRLEAEAKDLIQLRRYADDVKDLFPEEDVVPILVLASANDLFGETGAILYSSPDHLPACFTPPA